MKVVLLSLFVLAVSCKNGKAITESNDYDAKLTLLLQDSYFVTDTAETIVVRDAKSLQVFFTRVNKTRKLRLTVPEVDFSKETVLIACMGEQKTNALPRLKVLQENEAELVVGIYLKEEGNTTTNSTTSYPFCVYKTPISNAEVVFKTF